MSKPKSNDPIVLDDAADLFAREFSKLWKLEEDVLVGPHGYEIPLDRVRNGVEALDWVAHVAGKGWADAECLRQLSRRLLRHLRDRSQRRGKRP